MTEDRPITLADAAKDLGLSVWTLRDEADRGRLTIYRIGKRLWTRPSDIEKMQGLCGTPMPTNKPLDQLLFVAGGVYVIGFSDFIKIGWSLNINERIDAIQQGVPLPLTLHRWFDGSIQDERALHRRFKKYRTRGEWFRREGELAKWIERGCI